MGLLFPDSAVVVLGDQITVEQIKNTVIKRGFEFVQVQSLQLGAYRLQKIHTQLIILDSDYPEFSREGVDLLFKKNPKVKNIPIVLLTRSAGKLSDFNSDSYQNIEIVEKSRGNTVSREIDKYLEPSIMLKFWGVRGSTPSANVEQMKYGGNTTCLQIESPNFDEILILDSGTGIRNLGNEIAERINNQASGHLFITHPHWDHIQGFPFFKPFYHNKNSFKIHMPGQYRGGTEEILAGHLTKTFFPVTLDMFEADIEYITQKEQIAKYNGFTIEYMVANHPTKTAMYKIQTGGYIIVFAPDNELSADPSPFRFMDKFEHFISDCDLLIHDAQFDRETYKERPGWGHSAWEDIVDIARRCNVKRLYLTHHDPDSTDEYLDRINKKLESYIGNPFREIELAKEGAVIKLPLKKALQKDQA
jgi:phosphoribosyl 1,2-cyclic phosphodiesterase/CheY-like chemotaxis protein